MCLEFGTQDMLTMNTLIGADDVDPKLDSEKFGSKIQICLTFTNFETQK